MRRVVVALSVCVSAAVVAACGAMGAPDRGEVRQGLVTVLMDNAAQPSQRVAEQTADCMLDRLYDSLDNSTLQSWADADGEITEVTDNIPVLEASRDCSRQAADEEAADEPVPDRADVHAGLTTSLMTQAAAPSEQEAGLIADCMLDRLGEDVSDDTLRSWAEGSAMVTSSDASSVREVGTECGETVLGG